MPLTIRPRALDTLPVSLVGITPDGVAGKSLADIKRLPVWQGNRRVPLGELFYVAGSASDQRWYLEGDFSSVHHLAQAMHSGEVQVEGHIGRHAGRAMRGGSLHVAGNAGDWLAAHLHGGEIEVTGDAGDHVAAADVGCRVGMQGGQVLVRGSVGTHAAAGMRRGWITVLGDAGEWAGYRMRAGTLMVFGRCGRRPGAGMRRGTLALLGTAPELLPTFRYACGYQPQVLAVMLGQLQRQAIATRPFARPVSLDHGDLLEGGRGEIWLAAERSAA